MPSHRIRDVRYLAAHYALSGAAGVITPDGTGRYPATLVNAPTFGTFLTGRGCIELNGTTQYVNCGDILELNAVSAFSICFWMNQDVLDMTDWIFLKYDDGTHNVAIGTNVDGNLYLYVENGGNMSGFFDYSTVIAANNWHHVAMIFDGSGAANADRLICYVDGAPITLAFNGTIPALTDDLAGIDAHIGTTVTSFDGELYDFRIHSCALSRDEVIEIMHEAVPV